MAWICGVAGPSVSCCVGPVVDPLPSGRWPVVVIGAGPAGALAALELARQGVPVLLVERRRFPRWKVCGACLSGQALAALRVR